MICREHFKEIISLKSLQGRDYLSSLQYKHEKGLAAFLMD
jgi:hypothetical protein